MPARAARVGRQQEREKRRVIMLTITGNAQRFCDGVSRRNFLKIGALGMGGMALPELLRAEAQAQLGKSQKSIIMVYLPGGPSHQDMYDLKMNALPRLPPLYAVPYRVFPDKINPAYGVAPSLLVRRGLGAAVKLCRFVKPVPLVLTANTVPWPELPPRAAAPYRVLPDKINPAYG